MKKYSIQERFFPDAVFFNPTYLTLTNDQSVTYDTSRAKDLTKRLLASYHMTKQSGIFGRVFGRKCLTYETNDTLFRLCNHLKKTVLNGEMALFKKEICGSEGFVSHTITRTKFY